MTVFFVLLIWEFIDSGISRVRYIDNIEKIALLTHHIEYLKWFHNAMVSFSIFLYVTYIKKT